MSRNHKTRKIMALILILILVLALLLLCRDKIIQTVTNTTRQKSTRETENLQGEGSLLVTGQGQDLYYVFNAVTGEKIDFTKTGAELVLPAGKYKVRLHGIEKNIVVRGNEQSTLTSGALLVSGTGKDLYEVYDKSGETKLDFTSTGNVLEFFPGVYTVQLHGISQTVTVSSGDTSITHAGRLKVKGNTSDLFYVFDQSGQKKLDFTRVGGEMELLAGTYLVKVQNKTLTAQLKPGEVTVLDANNN